MRVHVGRHSTKRAFILNSFAIHTNFAGVLYLVTSGLLYTDTVPLKRVDFAKNAWVESYGDKYLSRRS